MFYLYLCAITALGQKQHSFPIVEEGQVLGVGLGSKWSNQSSKHVSPTPMDAI
jgi:hypothetical protein